MLCLEQNPSSSTSLLPRLCDLLLRKSGVDPEKRSEVGRILGFGLDKENISEGFEPTLMQNRGNLTPSPTALYSSFSSTRCQPSYESERERGRGRMRYLPRHPPFFHQWAMDGEVGAKKTTGPSNEREKKEGIGVEHCVSATRSAISGPIQTSPSPPLISRAGGTKGELVDEI